MTKSIFVFAAAWLLLLAGPSPLHAQALTLDEAIRMAVANNRDLKMAELDMEKANKKVTEAIGNALPSLSATGQYSRAIEKTVFFLPDFANPGSGRITPIEIGADHSIQFGFSATQILFNSAVFEGVGTAKIYQKAARELYRAKYNGTVASVRKAFHGVLYAQRVLEMTRSSLRNAEDNLRNVEVLYKQGVVSEYDFLRARVQTENVRPAVLSVERQVQEALNGLKIILGVPVQNSLEISGELTFQPVDPGILSSAAQALTENNAMLKALEYQKSVNEELIAINRSEYLPTLSAFGNYQWQAQKNVFSFGSNDFVRSSTVGLSLNLNLFNGFQTTARVGQAKMDFMKSEEQLLLTTEAFRSKVQSIALQLDEASKRYETQGETVTQAEKGYSIARTRYSTGSGTQLEVNDADLALLTARLNRIRAIFDYTMARIDLEEILCLYGHPNSKE